MRKKEKKHRLSVVLVVLFFVIAMFIFACFIFRDKLTGIVAALFDDDRVVSYENDEWFPDYTGSNQTVNNNTSDTVQIEPDEEEYDGVYTLSDEEVAYIKDRISLIDEMAVLYGKNWKDLSLKDVIKSEGLQSFDSEFYSNVAYADAAQEVLIAVRIASEAEALIKERRTNPNVSALDDGTFLALGYEIAGDDSYHKKLIASNTMSKLDTSIGGIFAWMSKYNIQTNKDVLNYFNLTEPVSKSYNSLEYSSSSIYIEADTKHVFIKYEGYMYIFGKNSDLPNYGIIIEEEY